MACGLPDPRPPLSTAGTQNENFGQIERFARDNHRSGTSAAALFASLDPAALDWTPRDIAASGCGVVPLPPGRAGAFFGGTMTNTTYCGAVDPAGPRWYQGWTVYAVN